MKKLVLTLICLLSFIVYSAEKIVITSDSQYLKGYKEMVPKLENEKPDIMVLAGDCVTNGFSISEWEEFDILNKNLYAMTGNRFYSAMGNHDANSPNFFKRFTKGKSWYSFESSEALFIFMDSNIRKMKDMEEQLKWLEETLAKNSKSNKASFVVIHHPFYSFGNTANGYLKLKGVPLFEKYGVKMVLQGHEHSYEKIIYNGIIYLTVGGFPQNNLNEEKSNIEAYAQKNNLTSRFETAENKVTKAVMNNGDFIVQAENFVRVSADKGTFNLEAVDINGNILDKFDITIN